ncbi:MAG TPA: sugar phosphate isomerase/epimerase family protein [Planctomycetaceae bacterium]|nr:sugar phosphate isomerase/epimerase family protein [Planctomycetaceae bacterium]
MIPTLFSVSYAGFWGQHRLGLIPFLEKAAALGYPTVELMGKRPHLSSLDADSSSVEEIRSAAQRLKIEVSTIAGYTDFTAGRSAPEVPFVEMQLMMVKRLAELAHGLDAKIVRVFSGYFTDLADHQADWTKCVVALREAAALCADEGIILGLQNHHDVGVSVDGFVELLDDVDHPNLKAMFDPWSIALCGADLYAAAKWLAPRMVQTTLADYVRIERFQYQSALVNYRAVDPPAVRAVPLGDGFMDLDAFFAGLKDGGFDGYVAYEICSPIRGGGSEANLDHAARHALERIRKWSA